MASRFHDGVFLRFNLLGVTQCIVYVQEARDRFVMSIDETS
jgi:hypothetical protein